MKYFLPLLIVVLFYFCTAYNSSKRAISSKDDIPQNCEIASLIPLAWKEDSNGCDGARGRLLDLIDSVNLAGYSRKCIYFALSNQPN